jgi:hypothetical protein
VAQHEQETLSAQLGNQVAGVGGQALDFSVLRFVQPLNPEVNGVVESRQRKKRRCLAGPE